MIRLFLHNSIGQILVVAAAVVVLWVRAFVVPVAMPVEYCYSPLYDLLYGWLSSTPRLASGIALVSVVAGGAYLNRMLTDHKITKSHSLMPLFLYVLVMSWDATMLTVTPMLLVSLLLLGACSNLLSDGTTQLSFERNFNASFFIGLMALCHLPAIGYVLPFVFVFVTYKMYRWRHFIVAILGLVAPLIVLLTYNFLTDKIEYCLILMRHDLLPEGIGWVGTTLGSVIPTVVYVLFLLAAVAKQIGSLGDRTVGQRINTSILCLPLLASVIMSIYVPDRNVDIGSTAMTFAFAGSRFFVAERKRQWISEALVWIFIATALIS